MRRERRGRKENQVHSEYSNIELIFTKVKKTTKQEQKNERNLLSSYTVNLFKAISIFVLPTYFID